MEINTNYNNYNKKEKWNKLISDNTCPASFLQSWEWGEFNKTELGNSIERWAVVDNDVLKICFLLIKKKLPFKKNFYYCPRGLVWEKDYKDKRVRAYGKILKKIKNHFSGSVFIRINSPYMFKNYIDGFIRRIKFIKPKILTHMKEPGKTSILSLAKKSKEDILREMSQKTRYNTKLAIKKGVKIRTATIETIKNDISTFCQLAKTTAKRNNISIYSDNYYKKLIKYFTKKNQDVRCKLYIAEFQNKPLSAIIVIYFGTTATYLHGASSNENRNLMPNYLIQWQAIKDAIDDKMEIYDFWGISETRKEWAGITQFKKGFGGKTIAFLGTWDYVLNKKYYLIFAVIKMIKNILGFNFLKKYKKI